MTNDVDLSADLQSWIRLAGMDAIQGSLANDGRTLIWNKGGERRYFVDVREGYYVITSSDRMGPEHFHFAAKTMSSVEKYLYGLFGASVRKLHGLQRVQKPFAQDELKHGFAIEEAFIDGRRRDALADRAGSVIAIAADDRLVEFSHYADVPVSAIKNSFLDPNGKPLFALL